MPATIALCTIIVKNYVATVRTMYHSWHEHYPDAGCHVLSMWWAIYL